MPPGLQRGDHDLPTSDGTALFVPAYVATFDTAPENFAVYKVAILHQLGFYDCGTFTFRLHEWQRLAPHVQPLLPRPQSDTHRVSAFEQFFSSFAQPDYARHLFTVLEDARIDAFLARQYKGLRQDLSRLMQHSLTQRPDLSTLRLRQALLEGLLQLTLGGDVASVLTPTLHLLLQRLYQRAQRVERPDATVYDTATAVTECYHLIMQIPQNAMLQLAPEALEQLQALTAAMDDDADMLALADMFQQAGEGADVMPIMPESDEPALGTEPVPYRGDLKPELIEKKLQLQELTEELDRLQEGLSPLPPEVLKELLENGNVEITSLQEGDLQGTSGLFLSDLEGRQNELRDDLARLESLQEAIESLDSELGDALGHLKPVDSTYLYDEWDYQMQDYRRGWCRLNEIVLDEEDTSFIQETRQRHAELLNQIRQQFQLLKPEMFKKIKRLIDGEEIDLDSAIEAHIDRRAGNMPSEKVYTRRQKRDRDVAAAFLLDMSASTDDEVPEILETETVEVSEPTPPRPFDFSGFVVEDYYQAPAKPRQDPNRRRIIDVEKEALVLMAEALETLGDAYAVYGFSGYGRDQVEFFVAKEFTELYDSRAQGRIAAMKPHRSTRMGPAIRHAIRKLERQDARIKTLLMLSDGYPQDFDYGKDRKSKDYGIQDTMMALREAQLKGIQTFCITVDPSGHDYLREMCPDQQYLVIDDITALPDELPKVYRGLTT
jgi:nitric oxide reductase activation protein